MIISESDFILSILLALFVIYLFCAGVSSGKSGVKVKPPLPPDFKPPVDYPKGQGGSLAWDKIGEHRGGVNGPIPPDFKPPAEPPKGQGGSWNVN